LRHSKVKLTWDDDDPERSKITRRRLTRKEVDEGDFGALLASSSSEDEDEDQQGEKLKDRERMRALLLDGDNDDLPEGWGDDSDDKGADLEITFMPALSANAPKDAEEETTLDRYRRKQKEKRAQRKAKQDPVLTEQPEDADGDFFGEDSDAEPSSKPAKPSKPSKAKKEKASSSVAPRNASTDAELALLLAPDSGAAADAEPKHFDMRAVLKAEKTGRVGKKGRRRDKKDAPTAEVEDGQDFRMDVKDERFSALHEDHAFAIDPSNPQ
jgi:hypothetical protein